MGVNSNRTYNVEGNLKCLVIKTSFMPCFIAKLLFLIGGLKRVKYSMLVNLYIKIGL